MGVVGGGSWSLVEGKRASRYGSVAAMRSSRVSSSLKSRRGFSDGSISEIQWCHVTGIAMCDIYLVVSLLLLTKGDTELENDCCGGMDSSDPASCSSGSSGC